MRIGVNALYLIPGGVGGTEIYLRALLCALAEIDSANEYFIFTNRETGLDLAPKAANFRLVREGVRAASRPARILWEQTVLPLACARLRLDVLLNPGFTAPLLCPCPQVTVFHDLQHKRHPEYFRWFDLPFWNFFLYWSARVSRLVLAISDATAADLRGFYRLPAAKLRTVPLGVDPVFFDIARRRALTPPQPFLLAVSTLHPHKNLDGLLRAFALFRRTHPEFRLVVCGMHGFFTGPLHELRQSQSLGLTDASSFPDGFRARISTAFTRAPSPSSIRRVSKASVFRSWRLSPPAFPPPARISNPYPVSPPMPPCNSIGTTPKPSPQPWCASSKTRRCVNSSREPVRAAQFSWTATAQQTLSAIEAASGQDRPLVQQLG